MDNVNDVLGKVMHSLGLDRKLREHTLVAMWPTFVSGAIADRSRPLFIDSERNLVVSVADSVTGQEISMMRSKLLEKIGPAARSLSIEIRGLRLDMKHFRSLITDSSNLVPDVKPLPRPSDEDLWSIDLQIADLQQIANLRAETGLGENAQPDAVQQKILRIFEIELRLRRWQLEQGFPVCPVCKNPSGRFHRKTHNNGTDLYLCLECYCKP